MENYILTCIFIFWTLFWSFASVIISRIKDKKSWIISGRSECPNCKHKLWLKDLFPILSYLNTWWKCRYCKNKISRFYPTLELFMWLAFLLTSIFLIDINLIINLDLIEISKLWFFLLITFLTVIFVVYDILYLEIPDSVLVISILATLWVLSYQTLNTGQLIYTIPPWLDIIPDFINYISIASSLAIIWGLYVIMLKWLKEIYDIFIIIFSFILLIGFYFYFWFSPTTIPILNWVIWALLIFTFFFLQIILSWGRWMWGWDLRIAILMWLMLWVSYSFAWVMVSYFTWSIIWLIMIAYKKLEIKKKEKRNLLNRLKKAIWLKVKKELVDTQIPFWPFLAIWLFIILFYWNIILQFIGI